MSADSMPLPDSPFEIDSLPRGSPVRRLLMAAQDDRETPRWRVVSVIRLLRDASPWRYEEREAAAWAIANVKLSASDKNSAGAALTDILADDLPPDFMRVWRSLLEAVMPAILMSVGAASVAAATLSYLPLKALVISIPVTLVLALFLVLVPSLLLSRKIGGEKGLFNRLRAAAAESLGKLAYRDAVGTLAESLFDSNSAVRQNAHPAFIACVGALRGRDLGTLRPKTGKQLCSTMKHMDSVIVSAALDALQKVGESAAIPHIERFTRESESDELRLRAESVLAVLEERKANEKHSRRLVRSSNAPEDEAERLLRTALSPDLSPKTLVRSADANAAVSEDARPLTAIGQSDNM